MNRYERYKKVGLPWMKEVPEHWEVKRNKSIFKEKKEVVGGRFIDYKLLSLTLRGVIERNLDGGGKFPASFEKYVVVKPNDFVFCLFDMDETPRTIGLSSKEGMITGAYTIFEACTNYSSQFLNYFYLYIDSIKGLKPYYSGLRKTVNLDKFNSIKIPIPPLDEQEKIAAYLDWKISEIDQLILVEKEKTAQLEIYKQKFIDSVINKLVDPSIPLREILSFGKGLSITKENLGANGTRCISYGEIHGGFRFSFISNDKRLKGLEKSANISISNSAVLELGDFVFADTSEDLTGCGNFSFLEEKNTDIYAGYHTIVGKRKRDFNSKYLAYYFESETWRKQIREQVKGIKVFSITQAILKATKVQIPNLEKQLDVVTTLDVFTENCENLLGVIQLKISSLESLKQSLISEVVTGKIDVRNIVIPTYEKLDVSDLIDEEIEE